MKKSVSELIDELVELSQEERHKASWEVDEHHNKMDKIKRDILKQIPPVREEVKAFSELMEKKLQANDHKGGWHHCSLDYLTYRMREEQAELFQALTLYHRFPNEQTRVLVEDECSDVANFAMMIADLVNKEVKGGNKNGIN